MSATNLFSYLILACHSQSSCHYFISPVLVFNGVLYISNIKLIRKVTTLIHNAYDHSIWLNEFCCIIIKLDYCTRTILNTL